MSFEQTTRKIADEVAAEARDVRQECRRINAAPYSAGEGAVVERIIRLSEAVEKLALCVARRFPNTPDAPVQRVAVKPSRADGGVCRDCGNMTVPTGACSTCTSCGSTGGCG